ncbi:MAG: 30S ribosomal protein S20 [Caldilineaceae bacterium]
MANIKSAEKRIKQSLKHRDRNRVVRGGTRTAVKRARTLIDAGDASAAEAVQTAIIALDRSVSKGVIHKNNAARRKSRLMQALNKANA